MSKRQRSDLTWDRSPDDPPPLKRTRGLADDVHYYCDAEGTLIWRALDSIGDILNPEEPLRRRYKLIDELGRGGWATVLLCWDRLQGRFVAVKVATVESSRENYAKVEIEMLDMIKKAKQRSPMLNCCLELETWFTFKGLVCMVFSRYGDDLYSRLKKSMWRPLPTQMIQEIGYQLFSSLEFLRNLQLVHTDIKLENILFEHCDIGQHIFDGDSLIRPESKIKLIDFGNAVHHESPHPSLITTRPYRAPEVILKLGWTYTADVWSVGCVLTELFLGRPLFVQLEDHDDDEAKDIQQLATIEDTLGPFPMHLITREIHPGRFESRNSTIAKYFTKDGSWVVDRSLFTQKTNITLNHSRPLECLVDPDQFPHFYDFLIKTLSLSTNRISPTEALGHPFFQPVNVKRFFAK